MTQLLTPFLPFLNAFGGGGEQDQLAGSGQDQLVGLGLDESVEAPEAPSVRQLQPGQVFLGEGDGSEGGTVFQGPAGNQFNLDDALDQFATSRPLSRTERLRAKSAIQRGVDPETAIAVQQIPQRQRSEILSDLQRGLDPEVVRAIHSVGEFANPRDEQTKARQSAIRAELAEARREQRDQQSEFSDRYRRAKDILSKQGAWNIDTERQVVQQLNQELPLAQQQPLSFPGLENIYAEQQSQELMLANLEADISQLALSDDPLETSKLEASISRRILSIDDPQKAAQWNTFVDNTRAQRNQERQLRLDTQKAEAEAQEKRFEPFFKQEEEINKRYDKLLAAGTRGLKGQAAVDAALTLEAQRQRDLQQAANNFLLRPSMMSVHPGTPQQPTTPTPQQPQTPPQQQPITPRGDGLKTYEGQDAVLGAIQQGQVHQGEEVVVTIDDGRYLYRRNGDGLDFVRELQ